MGVKFVAVAQWLICSITTMRLVGSSPYDMFLQLATHQIFVPYNKNIWDNQLLDKLLSLNASFSWRINLGKECYNIHT